MTPNTSDVSCVPETDTEAASLPHRPSRAAMMDKHMETLRITLVEPAIHHEPLEATHMVDGRNRLAMEKGVALIEHAWSLRREGERDPDELKMVDAFLEIALRSSLHDLQRMTHSPGPGTETLTTPLKPDPKKWWQR